MSEYIISYKNERCAFCEHPAHEMRTILEELPPDFDEDGELWRQWRPFKRLNLCYTHAQEYARYRFSVREEARPETDEPLGDGHYRTPAGWEYQMIDNVRSIGWVRPDS